MCAYNLMRLSVQHSQGFLFVRSVNRARLLVSALVANSPSDGDTSERQVDL